MNIGLFGGTFNPFHNGHLGIIQYVKKVYALDKIFLIPSATPPHKPHSNLAPVEDRLKMVRESLKNYPGFLVSDKELKRQGPSFTIDTVNEFKDECGDKTNLYLMMGSDAFLDITTWERMEQIFDAVKIIIMLRGEWTDYMPFISFIDENISKGYTFDNRNYRFSHKTKRAIYICEVPRIDISSSMIRRRISRGKPIEAFVPEPVRQIIETKELYI